jgi:hypothetical protein
MEAHMSETILRCGARRFQRFVQKLTEGVNKPAVKFTTELLCGLLFSPDLVLTHIAARVAFHGPLAARAKRFRRQLTNRRWSVRHLWANYLTWLKRRLDIDRLFIVDLTDLAKPYARKMEYLAWVRDADQDGLVTGYWCVEVYALDRQGQLWPVILWPYSVEAEGQLSQNDQVLKILSGIDTALGEGFGIYVFDCGFDAYSYIEPFVASRRHFIIRQRGDRAVVLDHGVRLLLGDLVEHLFAQTHHWLVYKRIYLPALTTPLYVVAYHVRGYDRPVILLTNLVVEDLDGALQLRHRYARRWDCETAIQYLKSQMGLERFAVRRYRAIQRLVFLAGLAMAFLSYLLASGRNMKQRIDDGLRYSRRPKRLWFYRVTICLQDVWLQQASRSLRPWCRPPP